jgi:DNA-binding NarL/FixJ family response regulator
VRVIVADAAVIVREGLAPLLTEAGFDVVGLARDAEGLIGLAERLRPDVAITDARLPPSYTDEGVRAAQEIRERCPHTGVLVVSQHSPSSPALRTLLSEGSGGVGYLLKERIADVTECTSSVERTAHGQAVLHPAVVEQLVGRRRKGALDQLTERERQVLGLMAQGRSNKAIAGWLSLTEHTIEKHVKSILGTQRLRPSPDHHRRVLAVLTYVGVRSADRHAPV